MDVKTKWSTGNWFVTSILTVLKRSSESFIPALDKHAEEVVGLLAGHILC